MVLPSGLNRNSRKAGGVLLGIHALTERTLLPSTVVKTRRYEEEYYVHLLRRHRHLLLDPRTAPAEPVCLACVVHCELEESSS